MPRRLSPIALALGLALVAVTGSPPPQASAQTASEAPKVSVAAARTVPLVDSVRFLGRGEAVDRVDLVARVGGFLREIAVEDGSGVIAGDVLFRIEPEQYQAIAAMARADVAQAEANLALSDIELGRKRELVDRGSIPQSELDVAQANYRVAEAALQAAQAGVDQAELNLGYTTIRAPIDGRLGRIGRSTGDLVGPETGTLVTLVREQPIYVAFSLGERQLADLMETMEGTAGSAARDADVGSREVRVRLPNGTVLDEIGRIAFADNRIDPQTGTMSIRARFENARGLLVDGAFLTVEIVSAEPVERLVVPQAAVQRDQRGDFVLVVGPEQTVEQRYVQTGETTGIDIVVTDGLREGEAVIIEGLQRVRPGVPVQAVLAGTEAE